MSRFTVVVAVVTVLLGGCAADRGRSGAEKASNPAQVVKTAKDTYALGAAVTPHGAVPRDAETESFPRGGEVYLSINVAGASTDQDIVVHWLSPDGKLIREDQVEVPKGTEFVAFTSGSTAGWREGQHRAVILINGRRVSEREFQLL